MAEELFDVVEVAFSDSKVIGFMGEGKTEANADAIIKMAIMRRGTEKSFYADAPAGRYKVGDVYEGIQ